MSTSVNEFFIPTNSVKGITSQDYDYIVPHIINAAKSFARSTYKCVYIIDYNRQNFLYASPNMALLLGWPHEKIMSKGYGIYTELVPEEDLKMLLEINVVGFNMIENIPIHERTDYTISYDFHFKNGRKLRLINHSITPIVLADDGRVWLALCTIALSSNSNSGNVILQKEGEDRYLGYDFNTHQWSENIGVKLTETERDVLIFSAQGYTMNEIAERVFKSVDTVKACKRSIFVKFKVKSISEALSYAANYRLL